MLLPAAADQNWFFSTLSQSAAAIIGIVGGFFVSRLLQQLTVVRESRDMVVEDFLEVRQTVLNRRGSLKRHTDWVTKMRPGFATAVARGENEVMINELVRLTGGGSSGGEPWPFAVSTKLLADYDQILALAAKLQPVYSSIVHLADVAKLAPAVERLEPLGEDVPVEISAEFQAELWQLERVARAAAAHEARAVPPGSRGLLFLLGLIAVAGVIVPLGFLSAGTGARATEKIALQAAFSLGLALLGRYLWLLTGEIKSEARLELPEKERIHYSVGSPFVEPSTEASL